MTAESKRKILIVEDDRAIRESLQEILDYEGYAVSLAENGQEALQFLDREVPSAILLDLMMPVMDGFAFLTAFQKLNPELQSRVPILLLTAAGDRASQASGIRAIIRKPIDLDQLLGELERVSNPSSLK